jgi:hypothetical protein
MAPAIAASCAASFSLSSGSPVGGRRSVDPAKVSRIPEVLVGRLVSQHS